jgi:hypothetical protein
MNIQAKLTGFAMLGATWMMWLLVGLSVGGLAVALDRAIYLIRTSDNVRQLKKEILTFLKPGQLEARPVSTFVSSTASSRSTEVC